MKKFLLLILLSFAVLLPGCRPADPETPGSSADSFSAGTGVVFTDALGHDVRVTGSDRVVAASASFAQTWLLAGGTLAGTTQDAFDEVEGLPESTANIGSLHDPSKEQILALRPQLVLLSADITGHVKLYESLKSAGIPAAYFSVENFDAYLDMLKTATDITGRQDLYEQNGLRLQSQIRDLISRTKGKPSPKILLLRSNSSKVAARNSDTMAGIMLREMGCVNIADSETGLLENLSMEVILKEDPDFIFAVYMGESAEKAQESLQKQLLSNPAWASLTAVKNGRYIVLPKELFHLKPNNRWAESYQLLWDVLYGS